ncbi:hypothetical protein NE237_026552 [Protea cynaroides]|uniref:Glucosidase 2 subunit beta n=1 Tax=Protea cynaroides TaxID=273540 RepID=A0A9Q0H6C6_9MAGN|nr:hypothetical protein NE237_026552 [Protea cynaroides]
METHRFSLLLLLFTLVVVVGSAASLSKYLLGVAPEDEKYFKLDVIKCKDGTKKFTRSQLNDDFCDCLDGTDEPGTSACPGGKFYCRNAGHVPLTLFSSRVNDGICDCCDGSDEYNGKVKCPNTCWEAGKVARDKLKKKIATYNEGVTLRKREVEQAKEAIAKDEVELSKLKNEEKILKGLVQQLKEHKEQIEKAEEKERLEREKEAKREKEAEEKADEEKKQATETQEADTVGVSENLPLDQGVEDDNDDSVTDVENGDDDGNESPNHGIEQRRAEDKNVEGPVSESGHDATVGESPDKAVKQEEDVLDSSKELSKEELGRLIASRWTGENTAEQSKESDAAKEEDHEGAEAYLESKHGEEYDGYDSETDDESQKYDDDMENEKTDDDELGNEDHDDSSASYRSDSEDQTDFSDITASNPSWLDKIQKTVRNILQAVNFFQTPVDKSEAARIRKEYEESSSKLSKLESRISKLSEKLKHDFGPDKEFYSFYDRCFQYKESKYTYKVCPFKQASQIEGHGTTRLGNWDKFEDSYRVMIFSNGDRCWNGPDRSLKVKLRCGLKNELADVDEPSRCEYVALLSTPSLCLEEKLKELQNKLEILNMEQLQINDEL